jgi:hypothetical protein
VPRDIKFDAVQTYVQAQVASPVVELIDEEVDAVQTAINIALISYWQAFPYTYRDTFSSPMNGALGFNVDDIMARVFPDQSVRNNAYFLGISRIEPGPFGYFGTNINSYLLGVPFSTTDFGIDPFSSGSFDYNKMVLESSQMDVMTGEVSVEFDPSGNVSLITPATWAQFQISFAFGFSESASLRYIPTRQLDLFRKMAAVEYLNIIINARSQVTINSDSQMNIAFLQTRCDKLKEEVDKQISDEIIYPISWG